MTRVLVVDDEEDIRFLARLVLERAGLDVLESAGGHEALSTLTAQAVDVMLLDLRMPSLDGWGVLEEIRRSGIIEGLGVIVLSAHADPGVEVRARAAGCRGYLSKPFEPEALLAAVLGVDQER